MKLGLGVAGLVLTGCPVGAALDGPEQYNPGELSLVNNASGTSTTAAVATTGSGAGGATAASTTSTTGGGGFMDCDVNAAMLSCQGSVCHGTPGQASAVTLGAGLDLFTPDRDTVLLNAPATYVGVVDMSTCPPTPELLVNAASPDASLILTKLNGAFSCGGPMPVVGEIDATQTECVRSWVYYIAGGAAAAAGLEAAGQTGIGGTSSF